MQTNIKTPSLSLLLAAALAGLAAGCATGKMTGAGEEDAATRIAFSELSPPARATVEKLTAGGRIEKIDREVERGRTVYDVEATVGGKHTEFLIAADDGTVLGTETSIDLGELPPAVLAAARKYFGHTDGFQAMKGVEYGKTSYEIVGRKKGRALEVTFDPTGRRIE
jgi:hypothetical protein